LKPYKRGYHFERRVLKILEGLGYWVARQAKSSFPDLIAIKRDKILLVECKVDRRSLSRRERELMLSLAEKLSAIPLLAYREKRRVILLDLRVNKSFKP